MLHCWLLSSHQSAGALRQLRSYHLHLNSVCTASSAIRFATPIDSSADGSSDADRSNSLRSAADGAQAGHKTWANGQSTPFYTSRKWRRSLQIAVEVERRACLALTSRGAARDGVCQSKQQHFRKSWIRDGFSLPAATWYVLPDYIDHHDPFASCLHAASGGGSLILWHYRKLMWLPETVRPVVMFC